MVLRLLAARAVPTDEQYQRTKYCHYFQDPRYITPKYGSSGIIHSNEPRNTVYPKYAQYATSKNFEYPQYPQYTNPKNCECTIVVPVSSTTRVPNGQ